MKRSISFSWPLAVLGLFLVLGLDSCRHSHGNRDEREVNKAFDSCKAAILQRQVSEFMAFLPGSVYDYFATLVPGATSTAPPISSPAVACPGVDLLLRTALRRKVPPEQRSNLTLNSLVQSLSDKGLLNPREIQGLSLGPISVNGDHASAELFYQGTLTALRLPFVKQGGIWKIDLLAIFPYAEVLMRVDRAITGQTQAEQVDQLVDRLPQL